MTQRFCWILCVCAFSVWRWWERQRQRILDARTRAIEQLGADIDLKEFHRVVLRSGGIPHALLDGVVDRYITEKLATP